uniref:RNase H type-1 domain-containing protein n=1 Tax=Brassica oleracea var. oleracea TaxID=109376 RepID=A0A0D2ZUU5_BRAOL
MGARNTIASQSPFHSEIEALIWAMNCMRESKTLVKMVSESEEWLAFASYLEDVRMLKKSFNSLELIHIPRTQNSRTDSLARNARKQSSFVVHMDTELPVWFATST